ncbi:Sphingosine kinase 1 [Mortierella sp. AD010]|nr:Sphingosine kinase 1 [Mortierella sp. AD010]
MSKQQMAQTSACFECNASLGDYKKTFPITLTLTPYELTFTPKESSIFPTSIPYCCIYGYNAPNKSALESSVQDSSQDQLFTLHYVKFTSPDLRAVSSPKLARMYLLFDQSDIKRFLALTEQLGVFPKPRRILLLVNPNGGVGRAKTISDTIAKPMLEHSGLTFHEKYTEYGKHAVDIAHKVDLKELDTLIVISGDGVLHEIINGLLTRPDWDQARHLPIGIIPAGSGNAIATSIGTRNPIVATLAVIRGEASKLDIFSLSQLDRPRIYSMLMFSWGMMADADIESDKYRWLGSLRFDIAGLVRMVRLRRYPGKVYVLPPRHKNPVQQDTSQQSSPAIQYGSLLENTHEEPPSPWRLLPNMPFYSLLVLLNCPSAGETVFFTDTIRFNDGIMRLWYSCETRIRKIFFPFVLDMTNGKLVDRGLMQDTECGGLLIVPGIEGKPDDPSTFNIVDRESVLSESAKRLNIHQRPGVFDVDGEVMPTARTLIEILPSFMNIIVPEWHYHEQDLEGEREKEGGDGREKAAEGKHKTLLVVEASKSQQGTMSRVWEAGILLVLLAILALLTVVVIAPTVVTTERGFLGLLEKISIYSRI